MDAMPSTSGLPPDLSDSTIKRLPEEPGPMEGKGNCLRSWKEIAAYLQRDPRTVQRWEKAEGLPVHRLVHSSGGSVYAFTADLDAWLLARTRIAPPMPEALVTETILPAATADNSQERRAWRKHLLLAGLATTLLLAAAYSLWLRRKADRGAAEIFDPAPLTSAVGYEVSPSFSPDGSQVAYASITENSTRFNVLVKSVNGGEERALSLEGLNAFSPAWSPDGKRIAFLSSPSVSDPASLWLTDLGGDKPVKLADTAGDGWPWYRAIAWTPDSKSLVAVGRTNPDDTNSLFLYSLTNHSRQRITNSPVGYSDYFPAVSPDGRTLLFTRFGKGTASLYQADLARGAVTERRLYGERFRNASSLAVCWDQSGQEAFLAVNVGGVGQIWRAPFHNSVSDPVMLASVSQNVLDLARGKSAGKIIFSTQQSDANLWRIALNGKSDGPQRGEGSLASTRDELSAQYSPDGTQLAFESNRSGAWQIWVAQRDGSNAKALTHFGGPVTGSPAWSPDGKWLAFDSRVNGKAEIYIISTSGGEPVQLTRDNEPNVVPSWSRDGHWIYFSSPGGGSRQIWKINRDDGQRVQITKGGGFKAQESEDGTYIYYTKSHQLITSLWRVPIKGGLEEQRIGSVLDRNFTLGRKGIFYATAPDIFSAPTIYFRGFDSPKANIVFRLAKPISYSLALSPDEKELTFAQFDSQGSDLQLVRNIH